MSTLRNRVDPFTVEPWRGASRPGAPAFRIRFHEKAVATVLEDDRARALCALLNVGYWQGKK